MKMLVLGLVCLLGVFVPSISAACTGGTCKETRDMDLGDEERVEDRYLRRSNELLALFSKDLKADKREEGSIEDLGDQIRTLEAAYREVLNTGNPFQRSILEQELFAEVNSLCTELDIRGPSMIECLTSNPLYRNHDGSCNNPQNVPWGKAVYPLKRLGDATYIDGISEFCSSRRPSAREVSIAVVGSDEIFNPARPTQLVMHYGQFVDHDLAHIPSELGVDCDGCTETDVCCPISVPDDDPLFSKLECLTFRRSRPTLAADCDVRVRNSENQITSYLDSSNVYGSNDEESDELRLRSRGQMNVNEEPIDLNHLPVLPPDETNEECTVGADVSLCGRGGDVRAAEQPGLTGIHTVFVREHNRIATELHQLNPSWNDERLYQEARRIVNALYQHITYNEFLPVLLGPEVMDNVGLSVAIYSPYVGYDPTVDATITTEFATAAFRLGHSFVPETLRRVNSEYDAVYPDILLREAFFNGTYVFDFDNGGIDAILLGMTDVELLKIDRHFSESITSFLFAGEGASFGMDLVSLNIQRGRDHGLPSYAEFFKACHYTDLRNFGDLIYTGQESVMRLREVYNRVRDIDAFIGMVTEDPIPGAVMGPTAACVIANQFRALKYGDRFWYENPDGPQSFTQAQLDEIRSATYARLLCDNAKVTKVQPYAFMMPRRPAPSNDRSFVEFSRTERYPGPRGELPGLSNKRVPCTDIPSIDLSPWLDTTISHVHKIIH